MVSMIEGKSPMLDATVDDTPVDDTALSSLVDALRVADFQHLRIQVDLHPSIDVPVPSESKRSKRGEQQQLMRISFVEIRAMRSERGISHVKALACCTPLTADGEPAPRRRLAFVTLPKSWGTALFESIWT